jgi:hypothetical protein
MAAAGAGHVTDDTRGLPPAPGKHDVVIDIAGIQTLAGTRRVLVPNGVCAHTEPWDEHTP